MNSPVKPTATPVDRAGGSTIDIQIQRIHSTEDLERALGVDVEASYGCASFGGGSARFSFAQNSKVQSSSLFMSVTAKVELEFLSIDAPQLSDAAAQVVQNPDLFEARYGNMFVRGLGRGGLFVGVLRIDTGSSEESMKISAELEGSYGLFSASASTKFSEVQKTYKNEVFVRQYQEGGPKSLRITDPGDPIQLLTNANEFLKSFEVENPDAVAVPYFVTLAPTTIAEGPLPPNPLEIQKAQDVLIYCAKKRSVLLDDLNLLEFISENPEKFTSPDPNMISTVRNAARGFQADLDLIADCAIAAIGNRAAAKMPLEYASERGVTYPVAAKPEPMPTPIASVAAVTIPDFASCTTQEECQARAKDSDLTVTFVTVGPEGSFRVLDTHPAKGTQVDAGTIVKIFCPPQPVVVEPTGPRPLDLQNVVIATHIVLPDVHNP